MGKFFYENGKEFPMIPVDYYHLFMGNEKKRGCSGLKCRICKHIKKKMMLLNTRVALWYEICSKIWWFLT